jgi:hypothetical protein
MTRQTSQRLKHMVERDGMWEVLTTLHNICNEMSAREVFRHTRKDVATLTA